MTLIWRIGLAGAIVACAVAIGTEAAASASAPSPAVHVCKYFAGQTGPAPSANGAALPADVMNQFVVLRRAATPQDKSATADIDQVLGGTLSSYVASEVRELTTAGDTSIFLVPGYLGNVSSCLRDGLQFALNQILGPGATLATSPVYCLLAVQSTSEMSSLSWECGLFAGVNTGSAFMSLGSVIDEIGLVPDGVSSVSLSYRASLTTTAPVTSNFFASRQPPPPAALERRAQRLSLQAFHQRHGPTKAQTRTLNRLITQITLDTTPTHSRWLGPTGTVIPPATPNPNAALIPGGSQVTLRPQRYGRDRAPAAERLSSD